MKLIKTNFQCECGKSIYHPSDKDFDDNILTCIFCGKQFIDDTTLGAIDKQIINFIKGYFKNESETEKEK